MYFRRITRPTERTSLRVPPGMDGTVIDVRVFTRDGVEKDLRALSIERSELESVRKDLDDTLRILEDDIYELRQFLYRHLVGGDVSFHDVDSGL